MKWSSKIGQVAGIGIYIHWTFWLLIAWVVAAYYLPHHDLRAAAEGAGFVLAAFACVVLHELGHALTARRFGIRTREITLLPIGGVARLERMPEDPNQELWVALAGPAVNVVIAAALFGLVVLLTGLSAAYQFDLVGGNFLVSLMWVNVMLVGFNLIPAFPMDGGRVLRALLAKRFDYLYATQFAASVGQGIAILFAVAGFFGYFLLLFIALFVYLGAQQEAHMAQVRSLLRGVPVGAAMVTQFRTVSEHDRLSLVVAELLAGYQHDFPVVDEAGVVGVLSRGDLMQALAAGRQEATVGDVMRRDSATVEEGDMLERVFERMRAAERSVMPVVRNGALVGIVTLENIGEWMMIHSALRRVQARGDVENVYHHV